jgi:hypothetical protein
MVVPLEFGGSSNHDLISFSFLFSILHLTPLQQFHGSTWGGRRGSIFCLFPFMLPNCIKFFVPFGGPPLLELFFFFPNFPFHPVGTISCFHWGFIYDSFFGFHSPPNCNNFMLPFGGSMDAFYFPNLPIWPNCNNFMDPLGVLRWWLFSFFFFHSSFHPLPTISMGICGRKRTKVDNRSDRVILWWDLDTSCNAHSTDMQSWRPDYCFRIYSCYDYLPILTVTSTVHLQEIMQLWF